MFEVLNVHVSYHNYIHGKPKCCQHLNLHTCVYIYSVAEQYQFLEHQPKVSFGLDISPFNFHSIQLIFDNIFVQSYYLIIT